MFSFLKVDLGDAFQIIGGKLLGLSGVKGGGTIGSIISSQLPMRTADIGIGLLAMHSSCETAGTGDYEALEKLAQVFFSR